LQYLQTQEQLTSEQKLDAYIIKMFCLGKRPEDLADGAAGLYRNNRQPGTNRGGQSLPQVSTVLLLGSPCLSPFLGPRSRIKKAVQFSNLSIAQSNDP
jgi:hypothetical protein